MRSLVSGVEYLWFGCSECSLAGLFEYQHGHFTLICEQLAVLKGIAQKLARLLSLRGPFSKRDG